eukprot:CAMPEP_0115265746 /NCGR_PEP_ID=MMETSP0270-20121206/51109_1 /TAXON_ID=71861 /ORGANISM="Scrippsiella trochoidea, Strain CCMP3099" /LENGTH=205 /DNA_ID=CAMNT_0002681817 /DNA_START=75 /DNA_END=692 /DNA_ORIENTATION=-
MASADVAEDVPKGRVEDEEEDEDHEEDAQEEDDQEGDGMDEDDDEDDEEGRGALAAGKKDDKAKKKGVVKDKRGGEKQKADHQSASARAGLTLPVHRIAKQLKRGGYTKRLAIGGSIYLTAVIEYITAEILELAGNSAKDQKKNRIIPRHIQLAIRSDEELNKYMSNVTISGGGVIPQIHSELLPRKVPGKDDDKDMTAPMSQEY